MLAMHEVAQGVLTITLTPAGPLSVTNAPVTVEFRSSSPGAIRLLNAFDVAPISTFFSYTMLKPDGDASSDVPPVTMFSFLTDQLRYVEVNRKKPFTLTLQLNELWGNRLEPGQYRIAVTYFNQYGETCFKGRVSSNWIDASIAAR